MHGFLRVFVLALVACVGLSGPALAEDPESAIDEAELAIDEAELAIDEAEPAIDEAELAIDEAEPAIDEAEPAIDEAVLAIGADAWLRGGCSFCHGRTAGGGIGGDSPVGPGLRNVRYDQGTMAVIVSCGLPGTPMPAFLRGAYTEVQCYGMPVGERPAAGITLPGIFTAEEIEALVAYIYDEFVQTPQQ